MTEENFDSFNNKDDSDLDKEFCRLFFSDDFSNNEVAEKIAKNITNQLKLDRSHASYSSVTRYIFYECNESITSYFVDVRCKDLADLVNIRCEEIAELASMKKEEVVSFVKKTTDNIKLAFAQKEYIGAEIKEAEKKLNNTEKKLKKVKGNLDRIYAEFITLLGIFTAIAFSIFGGIETLSSLFSKLSFKNPRITTGFVLIIAAIIAGVIYGILFILMESIYKLLHTAYEPKEKEEKNIISKSVNRCILAILLVVIVVGCLLIATIDFFESTIVVFAIVGFFSILYFIIYCICWAFNKWIRPIFAKKDN